MTNNQIILKYGSLDEVLFRGKNKSYGAYDLRTRYDEHLKKSFLYLIVSVVLIAFCMKLVTLIPKTSVEKITFKQPTTFIPYQPIKHIDKLPKSEPIKHIDVPTNTPPIVVDKVLEDESQKTKTTPENTNPTSSQGINGGESNHVGSSTDILPTSPHAVPSSTSEVFDIVEKMPEFPGGEDRMIRYLGSKIEFTKFALENGISGQVIVEFIVNEDGSLSDFKIVKELEHGLDMNAMLAAKSMPKWTPGMNNGMPVKVKLQLPISYVDE